MPLKIVRQQSRQQTNQLILSIAKKSNSYKNAKQFWLNYFNFTIVSNTHQ